MFNTVLELIVFRLDLVFMELVSKCHQYCGLETIGVCLLTNEYYYGHVCDLDYHHSHLIYAPPHLNFPTNARTNTHKQTSI